MPSSHDFVKHVPQIFGGNLQDLDIKWRNLDTMPNVQELCPKHCNITDFYRNERQ